MWWLTGLIFRLQCWLPIGVTILVSAVPLPIQLPVHGLAKQQSALCQCSKRKCLRPYTHVRNPEKAPGSKLRTSSALVIEPIWGVNSKRMISQSLPLSLSFTFRQKKNAYLIGRVTGRDGDRDLLPVGSLLRGHSGSGWARSKPVCRSQEFHPGLLHG